MKDKAVPFANCRPAFVFEGVPDRMLELSSVARQNLFSSTNRGNLHSCYNLCMSDGDIDDSDSQTTKHNDKLLFQINKGGGFLICLINQTGIPTPEGDATESSFSFYKCDMFEAFGHILDDVRGDATYTARFSYINNEGSSIRYQDGLGEPTYHPPKKTLDKTLQFELQIKPSDDPVKLCREDFTQKIYNAFGYKVPTQELHNY